MAESKSRPEAREWLKKNDNESPLATNRFDDSEEALSFVNKLYELGAVRVEVDNILEEDWRIQEEGGPYADTLIVILPKDAEKKKTLIKLQTKEFPAWETQSNSGEEQAVFWWD